MSEKSIFVEPDIRKVIKDSNFTSKLKTNKNKARLSFVEVVKNFLGNTKSENCKGMVSKQLEDYKVLGYNSGVYRILFRRGQDLSSTYCLYKKPEPIQSTSSNLELTSLRLLQKLY